MKDNTIQQMLERYREGTLDDGELAELNRLACRDEVMAAAGHRATGIVRRRRTVAFTVAGLLVAGAAMWTLLPIGGTEEPVLVAEAAVPEVTVVPVEAEEPVPVVEPSAQRKVTVRKSVVKTTATIEQMAGEEAVVVCNNQCEADSVISDIWKFLTV